MLVVLRVSGKALDLEACLAWLPRDAVQNTWRIGEQDARGRVSSTSGFTLTFGETDDADKALAHTQSQLLSFAPELQRVVRDDSSAAVDIALFIAGAAPKSVRFSPQFMNLLVELGVELHVTAYPCSDEE